MSSIQATLDRHLQRKIANQEWAAACVNGDETAFPYELDPKGKGVVLPNKVFFPRNQSGDFPAADARIMPRFIVNIPEGVSIGTYPYQYTALVNQIKREVFSTTPQASSRMCKPRIAVVVGTNQAESLDPALNRGFRTMIETTPAYSGVSSRRLGFLWRPAYQRTEDYANKRWIYSAKKAFLLLKALSKRSASRVQQNVELTPSLGKQVPFQAIRERILKSQLTRDFLAHFANGAPASPVYLAVMDRDFVSLRSESRKGVFSHLSNAISCANPQSAIGCAYRADGDLPNIHVAVEVDMAVRVAMTKELPYSAYLPEPLSCFLLKRPNEPDNLRRLSFLGDGQALETRRLTQNGKDKGVFDDCMLFIKDGPVTTSPERWKTKKNRDREVFQMDGETLKALRGLSQTHVHPRNWANQVYSAIDFSCPRVTDATGPIMRIFKAYDPITRVGEFTRRKFRQVVNNYFDIELSPEEENARDDAMNELYDLGMDEHLIASICAAALASGRAIASELAHYA